MTLNDIQLEKVSYESLNPRQQEIFNYQKVAGLLADYGFNCIKLADDWQGADFLAYNINGENTLKVQLKSRITISKKYIGKSIFMAFPIKGSWYLIGHDDLVEKVGAQTDWLKSQSWQDNNGAYSSSNPNKNLVAALEDSKL